MNKPESLRGAKAYRYAKNEIENDENFESIFNHWAFSNAWGLFGLAVNPKTPLRLLKLMLESEYADLVQLVTENPVFAEMDQKIKEESFKDLEINGFPIVRDFLDQSNLYEKLLSQAKNSETSPGELTKLSNLPLYQRSTISHWVDISQIDVELDHYFGEEGQFILEEEDEDICEIYSTDSTFVDLALLMNYPIFPELKWTVMKNPNTNIKEISKDFQIKFLKGAPESCMFDGEEGLSQIDDLLPFRLKVALRRFSENEEDSNSALLAFLGGTMSPIEMDITESLILAHPKTSDQERVTYLESLNFGHELNHDLGLTFLTAGLYVKNISALKKLAESNNVYGAFCAAFNPNQTKESKEISSHQASLLSTLPEFTIEELGKIYEMAKEDNDIDFVNWLESFS
jgi:hypothetical protein